MEAMMKLQAARIKQALALTMIMSYALSVWATGGGFWAPPGEKAYTAIFKDEAANTIIGQFKKKVAWTWEDRGGVTLTAWDDEATFVLKANDGDRAVPNATVKKRILDLRPEFSGKLSGNLLENPN
jgi:hypothetical protein